MLLTVRMFEVSPRASLTDAFADLHCVFGLICRLVRAAIPSKCQSGCAADRQLVQAAPITVLPAYPSGASTFLRLIGVWQRHGWDK